LPVGGYAKPSIYMQNGRQYVAIVACGRGKNHTPSGDYVMVFTLPESNNDKEEISKNIEMDSDGWISLFDGETLKSVR
jgi:quinoprotein glucose dehydrogenase